MQYGTCDAGEQATTPSQPCVHKGKQPILCSVLCCQFLLDTVGNKLAEIVNNYKIGFVFDGFAKL